MSLVKIIPILLLLAAFSHAENEYKVKKVDLSNPACKRVISEFVFIDKKLLNLSGFFPQIEKFAEKYRVKDEKASRKRRDLAEILGILNNETVKSLLRSAERTLTLAGPCLYWLRDYLSFWVHDITGTIVADQWNQFFELE